MNTINLHQNFMLLHAFTSNEPLKRWVINDPEYISDFHQSWDSLGPVVKQISVAALLDKKISPVIYELFAIRLQTALLADDVETGYLVCVEIVQLLEQNEMR